MDSTTTQFLDVFAKRIANATVKKKLFQKVDYAGLRQSLQVGSDTFYTMRGHWKYTVGQNAVPGAPLFKLNGVMIDGSDDFTATQWIKLIQQYKVERRGQLRLDLFGRN